MRFDLFLLKIFLRIVLRKEDFLTLPLLASCNGAAESGLMPVGVKKQRLPSTVTFLDPASGETGHFGTPGTARGRQRPEPVLSAKRTLARGNTSWTGGVKT